MAKNSMDITIQKISPAHNADRLKNAKSGIVESSLAISSTDPFTHNLHFSSNSKSEPA